MVREVQDETDAFAAEVCWHYYVNGMTQAEIAQQLDATRLRVNQAIQRAKVAGMVKVRIEAPFIARIELQEAVRLRLGLRRVLVVPARQEPYDCHCAVGAALANYLTEKLRTRSWRSIGVSWGMTLEHAIRKLPQQSHPDLEIVSMLGGTMQGASFNSFSIVSGFAAALGANYSLLAAPIFLSEGVEREAFLAQEIFAAHFAKLESLDAAILTASDISPRSFLIANGLPKEISPDDLMRAGAIGDVLGRFLGRDGTRIDHPIDRRTIGVDLDIVRRIPEKVLAAAGRHKVDIIRAASMSGLVDTLVTDDVTAELIISGGLGQAHEEAAE
ncbi:transcriptional regulator [Cereibacter sphaeroides]|uniref:sugar-binding transcriptional regulator n=1 Tax=Cereibacter sphaeroides TaxID=1063 RepID=UPI001F180FF8|nr:sugar-binding domain-containing protein [Cereibacter sphaeroides]MCE6950682.1 transcriptional regulator [Cereibacter sphaeroides]MCE6959091.1 transcriptional regulator [Cereibacter sphaeroides]MCE6974248.1 transcriptional regulator [Cereibacter sphaeroides]